MVVVIIIIVAAVINSSLLLMDELSSNLWTTVFNVETMIPNPTFSSFIYNLKTALYAVAVLLLIIKFLKKLFEIYALWSEGDPDVHPFQLVIGFGKAMVVSLCFPYLWGIFVDVGGEILNKGLEALNGDGSFVEMWGKANWTSLGIVPTLFGAVFIIMGLITYFKFMKRGIEVSLMIVGVPLACIGLLDNDKGIFASYFNQCCKLLITTLFQILVFKLGISLALSSGLADGVLYVIPWSIACLMLVHGIPAIMQEFMIPRNQGGGAMSKVYSIGMLANLVRSVAK